MSNLWPRVMAIIDEHLLEYFRRKPVCEMCGAPSPGRLDPHHVRRRGASGGFRFDTPLNLVALCPGFWGGACHEKHGNNPVMRGAFERIIAAREGLEDSAAVRDAINRLEQRMVKEVRS
jgi:hypothetical protein